MPYPTIIMVAPNGARKTHQSDGSIAVSTSALVESLVDRLAALNRPVADSLETRQVLGTTDQDRG